MQALQHKFTELLEQVAPASLLFTQLGESANASAHISRILHAFSAGTLEKYHSCARNFIELWQSRPDEDASQIPPHVVSDLLIAAQRSSAHDRIMHRTSACASLKSLRWFACISEWQELDVALQSTLVSAYGRNTCARHRREAFPMPLSVIARWEYMVCQADTPRPLKLFLGAAIGSTNASIRFGDAQRVPWRSIQLSTSGLHASCTPKLPEWDSHSYAHGMGSRAAAGTLRGFYIGWVPLLKQTATRALHDKGPRFLVHALLPAQPGPRSASASKLCTRCVALVGPRKHRNAWGPMDCTLSRRAN